jgi:hypothetical protein
MVDLFLIDASSSLSQVVCYPDGDIFSLSEPFGNCQETTLHYANTSKSFPFISHPTV